MREHRQLEHDINLVLSTWNPIEVPSSVAFSEYQAYVPQIIEALTLQRDLLPVLVDILVNCIGLEFEWEQEQHVNELKHISEVLKILYLQRYTS